MPKRDEIITEAKKWVDVPYKHAGRNSFGVDCIGPVILVAHSLKISNFDTTNYSKRPSGTEFIRVMGTHMERIHTKDAKNGDVLVCNEPRHPCHCGFLEVDPLGQRWIIHAYAPAKKVIREPITTEREARIIIAYRYYGVED